MATEVVVQAGKRNLRTPSPSGREIESDTRYGVRLRLYFDAACTQLIGTHHPDVLCSVPRPMKPRVTEQSGVAIGQYMSAVR